MTANGCPREDELLDALGRGFVGPELQDHVTGCAACSELSVVAGALLDDRAIAAKEAAVPSAGTMWWRIQLRQRHAAQAAARRSLFIGQAASLMIAMALIAALFGHEIVAGMRQMVSVVRLSTPILLAIATWVLAAPIAGYFALRQK